MKIVYSLLQSFKMVLMLSILAPYMLFSATVSVTNSSSTAINDNSCFNKTFNIALLGKVSNTHMEVNLDHTYRADLDVYLTSPEGTQITLSSSNGGGRDNLYVNFDDSAGTSITTDNTNHTSTVQRRPKEAFSNFTGESSQGTWTLKICDHANQDHGTYNYATLTIDALPVGGDLQIANIDSPSPSPTNVNSDTSFKIETRNRIRTTHPNIVIEVSYNQDVTVVEAQQFYGAGFSCSPTSGTLSSGSKITCTKTSDWGNLSNHKDLRFTVRPSTTGTLTQTATIVSGSDIDPDTSNNSITSSVSVRPACHGCNCSLDDNNINNDSPGIAIPGIDGTTGDISTCFSGDSLNIAGNPAYRNSRDMYYFTVQTEGILTISTSSPNNKLYESYIGTSEGQRDIKAWTTESSWSRQLILYSGDGAYFYIRGKRGEGTVEYQVDLNFTAGIPIHATNNDYVTSPGQSISGNLITEDTGDGADVGGTGFGLTDPGSPSLGTITSWDSNGSFAYLPDNNVTSGTDTFSYTITDAQGKTDTATVTIIIASTTGRPFSLRRLYNIKGNMKMIGNSIMLGPNGTLGSNNGSCVATNLNNSNVNMVFADMDNDGTTANSTSAHIALPNNVRANDIQFVGLYWQARFINQNIPAAATQIQLKLPNESSYAPATADVAFDTILNSAPGQWGVYNDYQGISNITDRFKDAMGSTAYSGDVWIADVQANTTNNSFGAWMMILVYKDKNAHTKNISIYDGFQNLGANNPLTVTLSGFKTPKIADVDSTFFIFGGEGDVLWNTDSVSLTKKDGSPVALGTNIFSSSILRNGANVTDRNPSCVNTIGIDIKDFNVGQPNGDYQIIGNDQNSTTVNLTAPWQTNPRIYDQIFPGMFAFAADLYIPDICYDYTIQQGGFDITDSSDGNRSFETIGRDDVTINLAIKSEEGDFDFEYSKLNLTVDPTTDISFDRALYAPNNVNTFIPAIYSQENSSALPSIALGEAPSINGGTFKALQRYFSKFIYTPQKDYYSGRFEFDFNTTINFGSGPVPLLFSSAEGGIDRCDQSEIYKPSYGSSNVSFNVERHDSSGEPKLKYPLYTQTVGKDFDFDVVAYQRDPAPLYTTELPLVGYTVDVELINARPFNDANATFTCSNPDPNIIQTLTAAGNKSVFAAFGDSNSSRVDMSGLNIQTDTALRNAAFRIWFLVDENNTVLPHTCADPSEDSCFETLYNAYLKTSDTQGFCSDCSGYYSQERNASGCYACLRDHFAKAVCSRDNFSIRPVSYRLMLSDSNESNDSSTPSLSLGDNDSDKSNTSPVANIAAGYQYRLEGNATGFTNNNIPIKGYRQLFKKSDTVDLLSTLLFKDSPACNDTNNSSWQVFFNNGQIVSTSQGSILALGKGNLVNHSNVGTYAYHLHDSNWTIVDQKRYAYKTFPNVDDCTPNDSRISADSSSKSGCNIDSNLTTNNATYNNLYLQYQPYSFDLSDINLTLPNNRNFIYSNNINTTDPLLLHMAAELRGNILAKGKKGATLTNFTDGCAAQPLAFNIHRTMLRFTPDGNATILNPRENNTTVPGTQKSAVLQDIDICTYGTQQKVSLEREYISISGAGAFSTENNQTMPPSTVAVSVPKNQFADDKNGSALMRVYYNFERQVDHAINPFQITLHSQEANSTLSASSAHGSSNYIPKGIADINQTVDIYYGRVAATQDTPFVVPKVRDITVMPMLIEVYCDPTEVNCTTHNLTTQNSFPSPNHPDWWIHAEGRHVSLLTNGDGNILKIADTTAGSPLTITPDTNIFLNKDGNQTDINITIDAGAYRPYKTTLSIDSDDWLDYNCPADPATKPVVDFVGGGGWAGQGNTGSTVETNPYHDAANKRIEW